MEPRAFDALSRVFANGVSRRVILKTLATAYFYSLLRPILPIRTATAAQTCVVADVTACINAANNQLDRDMEDCNEVPNPAQCRSAARRRHDATVKACDPCPTGTRCESNTCCPNDKATCASQCTVRKEQHSRLYEFSVALNGLSLQQLQSFDIATGATGIRKQITRGGNLIVRVQLSMTRDGVQTATFSYGPDIQGIRNAELNSTDGNVFRGSIDGRAIVTTEAPRSMKDVRFADGQPPPQIRVDPDLVRTVQQLSEMAKVAQRDCSSPRTRGAPSRPRPRPLDPNAGNEVPPESHDGSVCDGCASDCNSSYADCVKDAKDDWWCPPCIAYDIFKCWGKWLRCLGACYLPGGGCCPVLCGIPVVDECCAEGQICMEGRKSCCPKGHVVCGNVCCDLGVENCEPDGSCGCRSGSVKCAEICCPDDRPVCLNNSICCPPNTKVCGGECCPSAAPCINDVCCESPNHICGGVVCCAGFDVCCPDICCGGNNLCIDGRICCPRNQVCGHVCCPPGQNCVNGSCAACQQGTVPCSSVGPTGVVVSICCPPGINCCLGVCCTSQTGNECVGPGGSCGFLH
jgi:hypothetical protein